MESERMFEPCPETALDERRNDASNLLNCVGGGVLGSDPMPGWRFGRRGETRSQTCCDRYRREAGEALRETRGRQKEHRTYVQPCQLVTVLLTATGRVAEAGG